MICHIRRQATTAEIAQIPNHQRPGISACAAAGKICGRIKLGIVTDNSAIGDSRDGNKHRIAIINQLQLGIGTRR